jgi:hypothetical protein
MESLLPHLFVLRFPLMTAFFLLFFPLLALKLARSLLANLLDLTGLQIVPVTVATCVMSWTALITGWMVLSYGPARFGLQQPAFRPLTEVPRWSLVWTMCLIPVPLLLSALRYSVKQQTTRWQRLAWGIAAGYCISGALLMAGRFSLEYFVAFPEIFATHRPTQHVIGFMRGYLDTQGNLLPGQRIAIAGFLLTLAVYFFLGFAHYFRLKLFANVPSLAYVLLLATLACWTLTGISFFLDLYRVPVSLVVFLYLFATAQISKSDHYYHVFADFRQDPVPSPSEVLESSKFDSIVLVAANGGGIQSAAWSTKVLCELDRAWRAAEPARPSIFAHSIRAISSVSGGSVGSMFFTAAYSKDGLPAEGSHLEEVVRRSQTSCLNEIAWGLIYPDVWRTLTPFLWRRFQDRGNALENAFIRLLPETGAGLAHWRTSVANGDRPANLFNGTLTESGGRLLIGTTQFEKPHEACSQFYELYKDHDLSVATAARLSATFPFVTPAARADLGGPGQPQFHVVDGGYYDNYGMATLVEWLKEALAAETTHIRRVLVLQIRGFPPGRPSRPDNTRGWFYQLYAPVETMLNARSCGQLAHNDMEFDLLKQVCADRKIDVESVVFQFTATKEAGNPPLSWHLSNLQKDAINDGWQHVGPEGFKTVWNFLWQANEFDTNEERLNFQPHSKR